MLIESMWTHGSSMQIEYPDRLELIRRAGYYIELEGASGTINWFHFAIPTPDIVASKNTVVGSVFLRFESGSPDAYVEAVHLYDGELRFAEFNKLKYSPADFDTIRFDPPMLYKINYGLGVSVKLVFGVENMSHIVRFSSAGCNFAIDSNTQVKKQGKPKRPRKRA